MILFIDGSPFHLQEESLLIFAEQLNGFVGHLRQRGYGLIAFWIRRTGYGRLINIAVIRRFWAFPAHRHVAVREQAQQRFVLTGFADRRQRSRIADQLVTPGLGLFTQRFALPLAGGCGFGERFRTAAQRDIRAGIQQLFGDRAFTAIFQRIRRAFLARYARAIAFTRRHVRYQRGWSGILQLGG